MKLTKRQLKVLTLLAAGLDQDHVARALDVSPRTVRRDLLAAERTLGAVTPTQAVAVAVARRLVAPKGRLA